MSLGLNKVMLIGYLGADPELKYFTDGNAFSKIRLATNASWRNNKTGKKESHTEWHQICFFNRLAEIVSEHCSKGSKIYVEGSLRTRKWTGKNNNEYFTTEVIGKQMQLLGSLKEVGPDDKLNDDFEEVSL